MASYVDRGGEQVYRPPFEAKGVDFFGFALRGDLSAMQASICERCLNGPSGESDRFRMAMPYALLVFNNLAALTSTEPPFDMQGHFPEHEMAFWTLVLDRKRERLFWFHPYILVDNAYALSMGREIYGFPKGLGVFEIPTDHRGVDHFSARTIVVPKFGPTAEAVQKVLVEVTRPGTGTVATDSVASHGELWKIVLELLEDMQLTLHEILDLWEKSVDMLFLKQFRDAADPKAACFQSIVETSCKMIKLHGISLYKDDFAVEIADFDSHPIRADLGLPAGTITPVAAFWTGFDFWIGPGQDVWRAGA